MSGSGRGASCHVAVWVGYRHKAVEVVVRYLGDTAVTAMVVDEAIRGVTADDVIGDKSSLVEGKKIASLQNR